MRVVEAPTPTRQSPSSANRQNKIYKFCPVSAFTLSTPAHLFFSGRADNACTNLLGSLVRYVRTRGMVEVVVSAKLLTCTINQCRTHLPRMARATDSCTPPVVRKEDGVSPPC